MKLVRPRIRRANASWMRISVREMCIRDRAKAEERRAMAVAHEQEMVAAVQEMRAKVVEAEAEVPRAMAEALREGKLGVLDYYNMQNVIADTQMRDSIARSGSPAGNGKPEQPKK